MTFTPSGPAQCLASGVYEGGNLMTYVPIPSRGAWRKRLAPACKAVIGGFWEPSAVSLRALLGIRILPPVFLWLLLSWQVKGSGLWDLLFLPACIYYLLF